MTYYKHLVEQALEQAREKLERHKDGPLSEAWIEANASISVLEWVLELAKDDKSTAQEFAKWLQRNNYQKARMIDDKVCMWRQAGSGVDKSTDVLFNEFEKEQMGF